LWTAATLLVVLRIEEARKGADDGVTHDSRSCQASIGEYSECALVLKDILSSEDSIDDVFAGVAGWIDETDDVGGKLKGG
jgi:hypothetical protein